MREWLEIFHTVTFSLDEMRLRLQPAKKQSVGFVPVTNNGSAATNTECNMQLQKAFSQVEVTSSWYKALSVTSVS